MQSPNFNTTRLGSYLAGWPNTNTLSRNSLFCFLSLFFLFLVFSFLCKAILVTAEIPCQPCVMSFRLLFINYFFISFRHVRILFQYNTGLNHWKIHTVHQFCDFRYFFFGKRVRLNRKKRRLREMSFLWPGHYIVIISFTI